MVSGPLDVHGSAWKGLRMITPELLMQLIAGKQKKLGECLVEQQVLNEEDLNVALIYQKAQPEKKIGTVLRELGLVSSLDFMEALTSKMQVVKGYTEG